MRNLIGVTAPTKKVDFLGKTKALEIKKLTGAEVKNFQNFLSKEVKALPEDEQGIAIQNFVIRLGVVDAADLTDEELASFPLTDVSKLAADVLAYSGLNSKSTDEEGNA